MTTPSVEDWQVFRPSVDFGRTSADYARYRAGFPAEFFARLCSSGIGLPGQRVLDLGSGTGTIARGLANQGSAVVALDPALAQLQEARRLAAEAGTPVEAVVARAEAIPFCSARFDVVTAGQCWHWFDGARAAAEVKRVLVPDGRLVIAHFDWLPLAGNVVEATEQLIERYNPAWRFSGGNGFHVEWLPVLSAAGFADLETFSFDQDVPYSHEGWRGRTRANAGVAASLSPDEVARFDQELANTLAARFTAEPLAVPHRVFAITARNPSAASSPDAPQSPPQTRRA